MTDKKSNKGTPAAAKSSSKSVTEQAKAETAAVVAAATTEAAAAVEAEEEGDEGDNEGEAAVNAAELAAAGETPAAPKRRGRPKGSKNAKTADAAPPAVIDPVKIKVFFVEYDKLQTEIEAVEAKIKELKSRQEGVVKEVHTIAGSRQFSFKGQIVQAINKEGTFFFKHLTHNNVLDIG